MLWLVMLGMSARADDLDDAFPVPAIQAESAAVTAALGAPAEQYDAVTATVGRASLAEQDLEQAWSGRKLSAAPDSLRRWGRFMLEASRAGTVPEELAWFAAEHVGLPTVPLVLGRFVTSDTSLPDTRDSIAKWDLGDETPRSIAVVMEPWEGGYRGVVVGIYGIAEFEPFPRVWGVGDIAGVPGTVLRKDKSYALYVCGEGPKVDVYTLPTTDGRFDIDVPLPSTPGAYRVTMSAQKREGMPDSSFFFTLYVGVPLPTAPPPIDPVYQGGDVQAGVNTLRARYGLPPLEAVGDVTRITSFLAELPEGDIARARAYRNFGRTDQLPELPHGTWYGMSASATTTAEAMWMMAEHPVNRRALFAAEARYSLLGMVEKDGQQHWLGLVFDGPPTVLGAKDEAVAILSKQFRTRPVLSEGMTRKLEEIAKKVSSGKIALNGAMREVNKLVGVEMKAGRIKGSATMNAFVWMPGANEMDTSGFVPGVEHEALAVGVATGDLGRKGGTQYAVALTVTAGGMVE